MRDLAYATVSPAQVLDLWLPPDATATDAVPLVVLIHGGGFRRGDKANEVELVAPLLAAGYAVASVDYRLSDEARFPAAVQDVKAAIRFLRANAATYGLDPARFAVWGRSAGGYLAAMVGATGDQASLFDDPALGHPAVSSGVLAVIDMSGPSDMTRMDAQAFADPPPACAGRTTVHDSPDSTESRFLGVALPAAGALATTADPATWLTTAHRLPAFVLVTGDADCRVPMGQSLLLHAAIRAAGGSSRLVVVAGAGHNDPRVVKAVTPVALRVLAEVFAAPLPAASGVPAGPR
ncbi:MAG: alpha/beta hydrolase [Chloroflexota bacterium]